MLITSSDNEKIKLIEKLKQKKYRDKEGLFLIETPNIIEEAYKNNYLKEIYVLEGNYMSYDVPCYEVSEKVMNKIKQIETSKVVGICTKPSNNEIIGNHILLVDGVQDPGNLGTIIRSAVAFNIDTIVLSNDSCDLYNDKVIRASEGNMFNINIVRMDLADAINKLNDKSIPIYASLVNEGEPIENINKESFALVIGNEGNGIKKEISALCDSKVHIKTSKVESLNVAIATSIMLYEINKE